MAEIVSIVSAVLAGGFAIATAVMNRRATVRDRAESANEMALRYQLPLLRAAFDLQTRLYNIRKLNFLGKFAGPDATPEQRGYAVSNTLYLVGQYHCFSEIIRRGLLYLDPADRSRQQTLMNAMENVRDAFSTTQTISEPALCLFRGEQRALGEIMLLECDASVPGAPRWDCIGYAEFVKRMKDPEFAQWFTTLRQSLDRLLEGLDAHDQRLFELQNDLIDLVVILDPACEQVPAELRERLPGRRRHHDWKTPQGPERPSRAGSTGSERPIRAGSTASGEQPAGR